MTGISADHGTRAELHPDGCTCLKCIDVAIVSEDSESITGTTYHGRPMRSRQAMMQDEADFLTRIADQREDMLDWRWSIGIID